MPDGNTTLTELLVKALNETPTSGTTAEQLQSLLAQLWTGNTVARERLGGLLVSLLSETGLMTYVRNTPKVDAEPDPEATLKSTARAVTITGRVLEVISKNHNGGKTVPRWLARLGLMLQGIVAVSLPGTLNQRWWTHGVKLLYFFECALIALAFVCGSSDMCTLAITAFGATGGIHLLTLMAGDLMREKKTHLVYVVVMGVLLALVVLAGVGTLALIHQGAQQQLCWKRPGESEEQGASSWLCNRVGGAETVVVSRTYQVGALACFRNLLHSCSLQLPNRLLSTDMKCG